MKRCPQCRRDYFDDSLLYCLDDGTALLDGPASANEPATAILHDAPTTGEAKTRTFDSMPAHSATVSRRGPIIAVAAGILFVAVLGIGGYLYYGKTESEISSIAVLPFINESGNPEIEYLSDGMTDTLINNLSRIPKLSVKARSSVFRYKGKDIEPQKVASDLNVQAIVNGRVMQRGEDLTLNLEVVDARSGDQIWGEQYVRKVGDLVLLQSDIARDVSGKLRQKLSGADTERVSKRGTENTDAYQQYLKGRFHWNKRTADDINKSIEHFQKAIELDPSYALAYAGLADSYVVVPSYFNNRSKESFPKARLAATKALEMDDSLAGAHATLADVLYEFDWKFPEAETEFKRAIELDENYATAHHWYGEFLATQGRMDEAVVEIRRAQECDPLSLIINSMHGLFLGIQGKYAESEAQLKKTVEMDPNFARAHLFLAGLYEAQGRYEEAIDEYVKHGAIIGLPADELAKGWGSIREAYRAGGPKGYWKQMLALVEKRRDLDPNTAPTSFDLGIMNANAGNVDRAFEFFERSFNDRDVDILRLNGPGLVSLRTDPRFQDLVRRVGLPQEAFK
jgi:TolB-like protein/Tfp pilus assembly protein PilF